ncbi:unnamed protein product [Cuscuta epithymum]|uniref:DNA-directed RNA polymerase subunit n=1 Tax=Cuscuta epithymum TaxID=186058 RepID=A0AAV0EGT5_9ASTE|nr:unnamed protein product [Cuscuta epithymum]
MEEGASFNVMDGTIKGIKFGLATRLEIVKASISDCPINHPSQLLNPFLGLPLEAGKCESCGTGEPGQCEGHFGYIELPTPIYHPDHVSELKRMLSLLCLKCLKLRNRKFQVKHIGVLERMMSLCCEEVSQVSVNEVKNSDGACYLELKVPKTATLSDDFWNFLEKYGFKYGYGYSRRLLPSEVAAILKKISEDTRRKLCAKGYSPQEGYILQFLPVPPNCLSVPDISDGMNIMSSDHSITMLRKVLKQIENIKSSRSGTPNFESQEVESNDLQVAVAQYLQFRGTGKASRDVDKRFGVGKESNESTTKAWLEKMKTLFIRKGSGFSSRSVITGDPYKGVNEIGLPFEIAQRITFEERVSLHNVAFLQKLVDENLCLTYRDGASTYSLREGSKGHTFLKPGQLVHRRIMDGDIVFINRPPTTHKHSLQALSVYVHDDHTVKINPLICGPLSADFDGDCIHLFYPQSLSAKAEVLELFSVEKQLLSSHTGNFNLQMGSDSLLACKLMFEKYFVNKICAQQLAMFLPSSLPLPALVKSHRSAPHWTILQILGMALPRSFDCLGDRYTVNKSEFVKIDYGRDTLSSILNDIVSSIYFGKGPKEVILFFNALQPLLMEYLYTEGFSISLGDFFISKAAREKIQTNIQGVSQLLHSLRATFNASVEQQLDRFLKVEKTPVTDFALHSSAIGHLIDPKSESALNKVVQQVGFLGLQMADKGKFYSKTLVNDVALLFRNKYPSAGHHPSEEFGMISNGLFSGLDPYQEMVHSISSREVIVRSTRGLTEPGTLFKNLMAILRDVVICYDGTVRNVCSNSIIQFEYGVDNGGKFQSEFGAGDPVGVLAATAMSNPAYKAVLDSSPSSNSSWEMMKEILLCGVSFKNAVSDRRVILYLNDCGCGRIYCREKAAYVLSNHLRKVCLKDTADEFLIEYATPQTGYEILGGGVSLVGHIHLNKSQFENLGVDLNEILEKCEEKVYSFRRKKKTAHLFRQIDLSVSACCSFGEGKSKSGEMPCVQFSWPLDPAYDQLEKFAHIFADTICPVLLETVVKGDHRVSSANIIWSSAETMTWIRGSSKNQPGELALEVILEKEAVKQSGDTWRIVMDSCIPYIHLIDTRRSIPYAIKQVQELLGISCAFEQAVQRLSTSVTMVTKGVLKDHLLLLANSMTCSGNLVGFNAGGIKALSRALNVQIPFAEATLFTPRKCFEKAAEKCHVDSLSSVVASCSWGKPVAVGTGSSFDILLDTRKVELNQRVGQNVYDFLLLMRNSNDRTEKVTDCLGADIEDLPPEDLDLDLYLSPERDSESVNPTFEDGFEDLINENAGQQEGGSGGGWEKASTDTSRAGGGGWDTVEKSSMAAADQSDSWSSWGGKKVEETRKNSVQGGSPGWDKTDGGSGGWDPVEKSSKAATDQSDSWGVAKKAEGESSVWGKKVEGGDGSVTQPDTNGSWGKASKIPESEASKSSWGKSSKGLDQPWGSQNQSDKLAATWGNTVKDDVKPKPSSGNWNRTTDGAPSTSSGGWSNKPESNKGLVQTGSSWGANDVESDPSAWGKSAKEDSGGKKQGGEWNTWQKGTNESPTQAETTQGSWGNTSSKSTEEGSWGRKGNSIEQKNEAVGGWVSSNKSSGCSDWASKKRESAINDSSGGWGSSKGGAAAADWASQERESLVSERSNDSPSGGWGSSKGAVADWGSQKRGSVVNNDSSSGGWGSSKGGGGPDWAPQKRGSQVNDSAGGGWCSSKSGGGADWTSQKKESLVNDSADGGWGSSKGGAAATAWTSQKRESPVNERNNDLASSGWGSSKGGSGSDWPSQKIESHVNDSAGGSWGSSKGGSGSDWASQKRETPIIEGSNDSAGGGWGSKVGTNKNISQSQWGTPRKSTNENPGGWGSAVSDTEKSKEATGVSDGGWGSSKVGGGSESSGSGWGSPKVGNNDEVNGQSQWGAHKSVGSSGGAEESRNESGAGWGSPKVANNDEGGNGQSQWVPRKRNREDNNESPRSWGASAGAGGGDWKNKRNRPPRPADDSGAGVAFTFTRQRLDKFTAEEQEILLEVEPIMQNIRRIMHQSGLNDGDPLTPDDKAYIVENVVSYHPDKASKIGAGVDYLMISKHSNFQDTRCFYVVSTDGAKQDFSYRKCLENMVKTKFPDKAETFNQKYFYVKRLPPLPRHPGWKQQENSGGGATPEAGTEEPKQQEPTNAAATGGWGATPEAVTEEPKQQEPTNAAATGSWGATPEAGTEEKPKQQEPTNAAATGGWGATPEAGTEEKPKQQEPTNAAATGGWGSRSWN